ncbi:MAG: PAC2 family protein [Solirubrobacterales bacterium]
MEVLVSDEPVPPLRDPILVCAFTGWNDAGNAASAAVRTAIGSLDAKLVAHVDPEEFFDFQANRPTIELREGQTRHVDWPENRMFAAPAEGAERDLILFDGTEPNLRWRTFCEAIATTAADHGASMIVSMGSLIADVVHSLPVPITGIASDADLVERLGLERSNYEGPTGVVGVLHDTCRQRGMSSASLWAAVPHYVAAVPNPKASLALVRKLEGITRVAVDASELEAETERYERQVDRAVKANPEIETMVSGLEEQQRAGLEELPPTDVPSGDTIAREFESYLRQQDDEDE